MHEVLERAARFSLRPGRREESLMLERGVGYGISPDGDCVPTPPRVTHADLIRALIDAEALDDAARDAFERDVNTFAIERGWTRVRIYPSQHVVYADLGHGQRQPHLRILADLLDSLDLPTMTVKFTDESGNYVRP